MLQYGIRTILTAAIDPGVHGGIATWDGKSIELHSMPETDLKLIRLLRGLNPAESIIEDVGQWIPPAWSRKYTFTFGYAAAAPYYVLRTLGNKIRMCPAQIWQRALKLDAKSDHGKEWKRYLLTEACRRYPQLQIDLTTADALLILTAALQGLV